jgi:hypothetical protein
MFTDMATISRPASAAVAPTIATLNSDQASSASDMPELYRRFATLSERRDELGDVT